MRAPKKLNHKTLRALALKLGLTIARTSRTNIQIISQIKDDYDLHVKNLSLLEMQELYDMVSDSNKNTSHWMLLRNHEKKRKMLINEILEKRYESFHALHGNLNTVLRLRKTHQENYQQEIWAMRV